MNREAPHTYFAPALAAAKEDELRDEGYSSYLESGFLQRLKGVSFLGVLDFVYELKYPSNRYVHTVCVSHLALELCRRLSLAPDLQRAFVIANILHDVGHAAFSHNSEPFLLEQLSLYHQGLLSAFFVQRNRFVADGVPLAHLLAKENDLVTQLVTDLVLQSRRAVQPLESLFECPLNCDKIEGNHRTLCHMDRDSIMPERLLELFAIQDGQAFVDQADVDLIVDFWRKERDVYWNDIYTSDVFSGEAMLSRALEAFFEGPGRAETFLFMTDNEAFEAMESCEGARDLAQGVKANRLFASARDTRPELLKEFGPRLKQYRPNKPVRREIEREIARKLGIAAERIISHFSRRKHFDSRFDELRQMELFTPTRQIPLGRVVSAFQNSKRSGDFFDIFYSDR